MTMQRHPQASRTTPFALRPLAAALLFALPLLVAQRVAAADVEAGADVGTATTRTNGNVLTGTERDLYLMATTEGLKDARNPAHEMDGLYPIKFRDLYVLMDQSGNGMIVNAGGYRKFINGARLLDADIEEVCADGAFLEEIAADIGLRLFVVVAPGASVGTILFHSAVAYALEKGGEAVLGAAGPEMAKTINGMNPFVLLNALFQESEAHKITRLLNETKTENPEKYQVALQRLPAEIRDAFQGARDEKEQEGLLAAYLDFAAEDRVENKPDQLAQVLRESANPEHPSTRAFAGNMARRLEASGQIGVDVSIGAYNHGTEPNKAGMDVRGIGLGAVYAEHGLQYNTRAGATTNLIQDSAYGNPVSQGLASNVLNFGVKNRNTEGVSGANIAYGSVHLKDGGTFANATESTKYRGGNYQELLASMDYKVSGITVTPSFGVGQASVDGGDARTRSVTALALSAPLAGLEGMLSDARVAVSARNSLDKMNALALSGKIGALPVSINMGSYHSIAFQPGALFIPDFSDLAVLDMKILSLDVVYGRIQALATLLQAKEDKTAEIAKLSEDLRQLPNIYTDLPDGVKAALIALSQNMRDRKSFSDTKKATLRGLANLAGRSVRASANNLRKMAVQADVNDVTKRDVGIANVLREEGEQKVLIEAVAPAVDTSPDALVATPIAGGVADINNAPLNRFIVWNVPISGINTPTYFSFSGIAPVGGTITINRAAANTGLPTDHVGNVDSITFNTRTAGTRDTTRTTTLTVGDQTINAITKTLP